MQLSKKLLHHDADTAVDLTDGLVAHYLLNNNADDSHGTYDGTVVGTVDFQGDQLDPLSGSVTIPATGGSWCSYWKDTGSGMAHITSSTIPTSLATDNYSNLRIYNETKNQTFIDALYEEGYYPKPLPLPTTNGLIAHYPLTGTAEDTTGNYDGTEVGGLTYVDDAEFGSVANFEKTPKYIDLGQTILNNYNGTQTITVWVKPKILGSTEGLLGFRFDNHTGQVSIWNNLRLDTDGGIRFLFANSATEFLNIVSTTKLTISNFTFISVTISTTEIKLYINGILESTLQHTYLPFSYSSLDTLLGAYSSKLLDNLPTISSGTSYMKSLRLLNTVLTPQEITDIYNYEKNFRPIDIDDGLIAYYPLAENSLDNYNNQYDGTDSSGVTYDGEKATIADGDTITFPNATGFVEAYYTLNGIVTKTTTESTLNTLTNCTLSNVRKYNKALSTEQQAVIDYTI
jgi:hypothetical protein